MWTETEERRKRCIGKLKMNNTETKKGDRY